MVAKVCFFRYNDGSKFYAIFLGGTYGRQGKDCSRS